MSSKSEKAMRVKRQPLADLKNQIIDPNVVRTVGDPSSTKAKSRQGLNKKPTSLSHDIGLKKNLQKRRGPSSKKYKFPVYIPVGGGEPEEATGAQPPVLCSKCGTKHHLDYCPRPCTICYSRDHFCTECPFPNNYPRWADYNRDRYHIVCSCGFPFNEDKWACASCPDGSSPTPLLQPKYCDICCKHGQHLSHECPKDKEEAALFKALRDHDLLYGWNTNQPVLWPSEG